MLQDPSIPVRMITCETLGNSGNQSFYRVVAHQAKASNFNLSLTCAIAAAKLDGERSLPRLAKLLTNDVRDMRLEAVYLLGGVLTKNSVKLLGKVLKTDKDHGIRFTAASLLGGMMFEESVHYLSEAIKDQDNTVLSFSIEALKNMGWRSMRMIEVGEESSNKKALSEGEKFLSQIINILERYAKHSRPTIQCKAIINLAELNVYNNLKKITERNLNLCDAKDKCKAIWKLLELKDSKGAKWAYENQKVCSHSWSIIFPERKNSEKS